MVDIYMRTIASSRRQICAAHLEEMLGVDPDAEVCAGLGGPSLLLELDFPLLVNKETLTQDTDFPCYVTAVGKRPAARAPTLLFLKVRIHMADGLRRILG